MTDTRKLAETARQAYATGVALSGARINERVKAGWRHTVSMDYEYGPEDLFIDLIGCLPGWSSASTRVCNVLKREGVEKVGQLTGKTADDLLALDDFGAGSLAEVRRVLAAHGMALAGEQ